MLGGIGGQEGKGTTEDEMAAWHHWLDGRESEWTLGVGGGQGGLMCCDSLGLKESDTTEGLNNKFVYWGCIVRGQDVVWWGGYFQSLDEELEWCHCVMQVSAWGWSREMIWGGRWDGGSGLGTHVHPWWIHVDVWQNQYSIVKQNKVKIKIKIKRSRLFSSFRDRNCKYRTYRKRNHQACERKTQRF